MGPGTFVPIGHAVKGTPATGRSTAEVEVTAIDRGTFLHGLPLVSTLETILQRPVRLICRSDNDAAISASKAGYSRKMGYIKKHQRVSLAALREVYIGFEEHEYGGEPSHNVLGAISTTKNGRISGPRPWTTPGTGL